MADFGDILAEWERQNPQRRTASSARKAGVPKPARGKTASGGQGDAPPPERTASLFGAWLNRHPVVDKDALDQQAREQTARTDRRAARKLPYDRALDLHGYTHDEARDRLDRFIAECVRRNVRKALIIHGKGLHSGEGDAVLPKMVRAFIERDPRLGASGHPEERDGGKGATWVIIR